jgi:hypothetical protein
MFLDLRRDRYLSVPQQLMDELAPYIANWTLPYPGSHTHLPPTAPIRNLADDLLEAGIIVSTFHAPPTTSAQSSSSTIAQRSVIDCDNPARKSTNRLSALVAMLYADYTMRRSPLWRITQNLRLYPEQARHSFDQVSSLTQEFLFIRPWYPRNYLCLFDSLALTLFLLHRGIRAQWIFGVREEPFAAHCWVQYDALVLNEHLDKTRVYTPIMIV